jgi:uncharacterized membrane protein
MELPSRGPLPRWVPFAVLAAAALYLILRWDSIPPVWTTHWNAAGRPNGWSHRTVWGVLGVPAHGALAVALVEAVFAVVGRVGTGVGAHPLLREGMAHFIRGTTVGLSLLFACIAIDLPFGPELTIGERVAIPLLILVASMGFGAVGAARQVTRALSDLRAGGQAPEAEGYHAFYYSNPNDARLWVPKLSGMGWTVNFAHPWAWPVMGLILAVAALAIAAATRR